MSGAVWRFRGGELDCEQGHLIGIVNATPDSFTDEGRHFGTDRSVEHGRSLAAEGASVVEVGGESLRFSDETPPEEEIARVVPVIERLVDELEVPVAVDTYKPQVARAAFGAGAAILNDPTGLREPDMRAAAAEAGVGVVLTHFFGPPKVRPTSFPDVDVPQAVCEWAVAEMAAAEQAGIRPEQIVIDPGVGLGKSPPQDLDLLNRIDEIVALGRPVFVPISNKKVIGAVTGADAQDRLAGNAAGVAWCLARGARIFRVHDVAFLRQALLMTEALVNGEPRAWHEVVK